MALYQIAVESTVVTADKTITFAEQKLNCSNYIFNDWRQACEILTSRTKELFRPPQWQVNYWLNYLLECTWSTKYIQCIKHLHDTSSMGPGHYWQLSQNSCFWSYVCGCCSAHCRQIVDFLCNLFQGRFIRLDNCPSSLPTKVYSLVNCVPTA